MCFVICMVNFKYSLIRYTLLALYLLQPYIYYTHPPHYSPHIYISLKYKRTRNAFCHRYIYSTLTPMILSMLKKPVNFVLQNSCLNSIHVFCNILLFYMFWDFLALTELMTAQRNSWVTAEVESTRCELLKNQILTHFFAELLLNFSRNHFANLLNRNTVYLMGSVWRLNIPGI